jgi:GWxTD domain-containing protein
LSNEPLLRRAGLTALAALVLTAALGGCRLWRLEKNLDPINADFLNRVRYIVTAEERRIFLELPDADRAAFVDEFWKRRDPDPETEENEFKDEYFKRMEEASRLFISEGVPGWMTDRGRIHILFGPPTDRIVDSMSGDPANRCMEIWYYGNFPVVFTDQSCVGHFSLVTYDLTAIGELNLTYMHALNQAQADLQEPPPESKKRFDVRARLTGVKRTAAELRAVLVLEVPYDRIWFRSDGTRLATDLDAFVEILDGSRKPVRDWRSVAVIDLEESELREKWGKSHTIEVPIAVEAAEDLLRLGSGPVYVAVTLTNRTGNEIARKLIEFR